MTTLDRQITNPRSGQRMIFHTTGKETNGALLEIESFNPPSKEREPEHIHPRQTSSLEVITGKIHFHINGETRVLGPGERLEIPAGLPHYFWNEDAEEAHTIQKFTPALEIEGFFRTYFALARDGKLSAKGTPNLVRMSLPMLNYQNEIQVVNPPWPVQKTVFKILSPLARLLGYKEKYE
ncbi:cupin domain-containing protein [Paenibacillus anseongense]|uniref:cupin domain-containing protein n=1 Tax=Paenibacillus anseongense TaxID=2682845 RepID=UPI002DB6DEEF|nr:cupin domain-containing protein [Paenibacillus anseongense]MEC0264993.1 cupin domain-containing protein [Paenibacillus anseongense]